VKPISPACFRRSQIYRRSSEVAPFLQAKRKAVELCTCWSLDDLPQLLAEQIKAGHKRVAALRPRMHSTPTSPVARMGAEQSADSSVPPNAVTAHAARGCPESAAGPLITAHTSPQLAVITDAGPQAPQDYDPYE
jgi:hypothetical protein